MAPTTDFLASVLAAVPCPGPLILSSGSLFRANSSIRALTDQCSLHLAHIPSPPAKVVQSPFHLPMRFRSSHPCLVDGCCEQGSSDRAFLDMHDRTFASMRCQHLADLLAQHAGLLMQRDDDACLSVQEIYVSQISLHKVLSNLATWRDIRGGCKGRRQ
jgi:hypothetical protein